MNRRRRYPSLILAIVFLDAMGIGVVFPILPGLLRSLMQDHGNVVRQYGFLLATYAATMLFASPVLGILSDRVGRRPVLLLALVGTALDDLVMALAPALWVLYAGRAVAGLTGANVTVANAYVADVTAEENRASAFGRMNACFGLGFVAGPILGGITGAYSLRLPFYFAACLNAISFLICLFILPESKPFHEASTPLRPLTWTQLDPFASFRSISRLRGVGRLLYLFGSIDMVGQFPAVLWVIYLTTRFHWTPTLVGCSFAAYGLFHAVCQSLLPALLERRLGARRTVLAGMIADCCGFILFACAQTTMAAFCTIPLLCLGGVAIPALQAMLSSSVNADRQVRCREFLPAVTA